MQPARPAPGAGGAVRALGGVPGAGGAAECGSGCELYGVDHVRAMSALELNAQRAEKSTPLGWRAEGGEEHSTQHSARTAGEGEWRSGNQRGMCYFTTIAGCYFAHDLRPLIFSTRLLGL